MEYILILYFGLSTVGLSYENEKECLKASDYYHIHYGEELKETACIKIEEDLEDE